MQNPNNIIKRSDKGRGVVILDRQDYLEEAHCILSDDTYYRKITKDPFRLFSVEYHSLINTAFDNRILTSKEKKFHTNNNPVTPIFYYLPKIHNNTEKPPGHPIIAGKGFLTSALSQYVDWHLQKYLTVLDSYLKDTTSLIAFLQHIKWEPNFIRATLDVTLLYSNDFANIYIGHFETSHIMIDHLWRKNIILFLNRLWPCILRRN